MRATDMYNFWAMPLKRRHITSLFFSPFPLAGTQMWGHAAKGSTLGIAEQQDRRLLWGCSFSPGLSGLSQGWEISIYSSISHCCFRSFLQHLKWLIREPSLCYFPFFSLHSAYPTKIATAQSSKRNYIENRYFKIRTGHYLIGVWPKFEFQR